MAMILRAKDRGLRSLIVADAEHLPFKDKAVDASIIVDSLNCFDDPIAIFKQAQDVTRSTIIVIKRKSYQGSAPNCVEEKDENAEDPKFVRLRERVQMSTKRQVDDPGWSKEENVVKLFPPSFRKVISDRVIETPAEQTISRVEEGSFRFTLGIPKAELANIADELRHEMKGTTFRRRRIREMIVWDFDGIAANAADDCVL